MIKPLDHRTARARSALMLAAGVACLVISGCGSSSSPSSNSSIKVGAENTKLEKELLNTKEAATAKTPTTGPLSKEPAVVKPSGPAPSQLVTKDLIKGTGAEAKLGDSITVNYVGYLYKTGKVFDASWKRGEPSTFTLETGSLIEGWTKGIPGMKVGGRRELIIPASLAYGTKGTSGIPPNSPLVFVIDLLGT
jgi:peptidylprolyl isomerase